MRAGIWGGHHGNRSHSRQGPGRLDHQDPAEGLVLPGQCCCQNGRVLRDHGQPVLPADIGLYFPEGGLVAGRKGEDAGDDLPECLCLIHDRLMFGCNFLGCRFRRIVHHRQLLAVDMGNDLIPEREESVLVGFFIFMNMDWRDFKGVITVGVNFFMGNSFVVFLDVNHQHVEME
jgi:hypothetical protein